MHRISAKPVIKLMSDIKFIFCYVYVLWLCTYMEFFEQNIKYDTKI